MPDKGSEALEAKKQTLCQHLQDEARRFRADRRALQAKAQSPKRFTVRAPLFAAAGLFDATSRSVQQRGNEQQTATAVSFFDKTGQLRISIYFDGLGASVGEEEGCPVARASPERLFHQSKGASALLAVGALATARAFGRHNRPQEGR